MIRYKNVKPDILTKIRRLWREGRDTMGIARKLKISEGEVWNLMDSARHPEGTKNSVGAQTDR